MYILSKTTELALENIKLPRHLAIIMDGNGRFAQKRMLPRSYGHRQGTINLTNVCRIVDAIGINYLTVYAFSSENWRRPAAEVNELFSLVATYFNKYIDELMQMQVKLNFIGNLTQLPEDLQKIIHSAVTGTAENKRLQLTIALNYGSRLEIAEAAAATALLLKKRNDLSHLSLTEVEKIFEANLQTAKLNLPDPDLIIRTAGEMRLSNFLLWQAAYAEFYACDCLWPEFGEKELLAALLAYNQRTRKFGALK